MKKLKFQNKIKTANEAATVCKDWKNAGLKIVFTNGCFDILHRGHVTYLSEASDLGDKLVVGVNTDKSVKHLGKSQNRPIQDEVSRSEIIASLEAVALVVLFDEDTPLKLIQEIIPDVLVKGADYKPEDIIGYDIVVQNGGNVRTLSFLDGYSTTLIERKIQGEK